MSNQNLSAKAGQHHSADQALSGQPVDQSCFVLRSIRAQGPKKYGHRSSARKCNQSAFSTYERLAALLAVDQLAHDTLNLFVLVVNAIANDDGLRRARISSTLPIFQPLQCILDGQAEFTVQSGLHASVTES